jgi:ribonuclease-3
MNPLQSLITDASIIEAKLGYAFRDKNILALAFTHRSFINENRNTTTECNERLEFLGDSVLGVIISEYLYRYLPSTPEGDLSYMRSRLVEAASCTAYVERLDLEQHLLLGKGERMYRDSKGRDSILADLLEAVIGAIYLDGGIEAVKTFIFKNFSQEIDAILKTPIRNWKAVLQDFSQKHHQQAPIYKVLEAVGPDHSKKFTIAVHICDTEVGRGEGASKKEAQQAAASDALSRIAPATS